MACGMCANIVAYVQILMIFVEFRGGESPSRCFMITKKIKEL